MSSKHILNVVRKCDNWILMGVFVVINANDWDKIINANLSFLKWFGLTNDAYVYRYAHWWDCGLHVQSRVNLPVLWAQLSIELTGRDASCSSVSFGTGVGVSGFPFVPGSSNSFRFSLLKCSLVFSLSKDPPFLSKDPFFFI